MAKVLIKKGFHAGKELINMSFTAVRPLSMGQRGLFVLVSGIGHASYPQRNFKVFVDSPDACEFSGAGVEEFVIPVAKGFEEPRDDESDDEIRERLAERFAIMERMVLAASRGTVRGLVISGAPGTGKSFGVEHALERDSIQDKLAFDPEDHEPDVARRRSKDGTFKPRYKFIKGFVTPPALYKQLYEYSDPREVLVFDDSDAILYDDICLGLLKSALDTSGKRELHWLSNSNRGDDAPDSFQFKGSVIFITNINFQRSIDRGGKLAPHLDAILDRCLYLDLTIHNKRDKLIRIDHVCRDCKMLEGKGLNAEQIEEVMSWVHEKADHFPRLSLRKVDQLADIRMSSPNWQREAEVMLLRGSR